jgi:CBS domain-containing protein
MTGASSRRLVHLPIRTLETLTAGGGRAVEHVVACPSRRGSVDVDTCRVCPHLTQIDGGAESPSGVVHCTPIDVPAHADHVGDCALGRVVSKVRDDVTLQELTSYFVQAGISRVAVVDASGQLVGVITERDLLVGELLDYRRAAEAPAAELVRQAHLVTEATSLRDALRTMARHHLREIPVVTQDGQFAGWLEDVAALGALRPV